MKEEKFPHNRKPSHRHFSRELWNLRGKHRQKGKKKKNQNMHLTITTCRKVAQTLVSISNEGAGQRGMGCIISP